MREYVIVVGGIEHTVQMSPDEAKRIGAREVQEVKTRARAPRAKAR